MSSKQELKDDISFPIYLYFLSLGILLIGGGVTVFILYYTPIVSYDYCTIDIGKSWKDLGTYITRAAVAALILVSFADSCLTIFCKPCIRKLEVLEKEFDSYYTSIQNPGAKQIIRQTISDNKALLYANKDILPERIWLPCFVHAIYAIIALSFGCDQLLGAFSLAFYTPAFWLYIKIRTFCKDVEAAIKEEEERHKKAQEAVAQWKAHTISLASTTIDPHTQTSPLTFKVCI